MTYWLDTNVFVEPNRTFFKIDISTEFWKYLDVHLRNGTMKSSEWVYAELVSYGDNLANWCKARKDTHLCTKSMTDEVQEQYAKIINYVENHQPPYKTHRKDEFYRDADPWVIAHALADGGVVVSGESDKTKGMKVKIPTVCDRLTPKVRCIKLWEMNDELGYRAADYV